MKKLILIAIIASCTTVNAGMIVSLAVKQGNREAQTNRVNTSTPVLDASKKVVGYSTSSSVESSQTKGTDLGVLVQVMPSSIPIVFGAGVFQDSTGMLTLGVHFE